MKSNLFHLKILTSKGLAFDDEIISFNFKNEKGHTTFLKDHSPEVGLIEKSKCLIVKKDNKKTTLFHSSGVYSFTNNVFKFIVDNCGEDETNVSNISFSDNKNIIIGDNEIIQSNCVIDNKFGTKEEIIQFEIRKIVKGMK
ncbi:MAG: hypothetical protein ACRDCF_02515 [Mycoplasmoidaceae bacterium]